MLRVGSWRARARTAIGALLAAVVVTAGSSLAVPDPADAGISVVANRSATGVTADGLPTVQINGIVWTQVVVGNTVYAGGQFSTARPAGAAPGKSTVRRYNLLAFDIRTGKLIAGFAPNVNGAVRALAVSPDKKTLYVGGAFTKVNGKQRLRFAALTTGSGALRALAPAFNNQVRAITVSGTTAYVGGQFTKVGKTSRSRLASFSTVNGKLRTWKPSVNSYVVALTLTPDRKSIVVGGNFSKVGKTAACGMTRLSLTTGGIQSWSINTVVKDCGKRASIMSLTTSGSTVYGSGYSYGTGNYEGAFAATGTGRLVWLQNCRGDTYDVAVANGRLYSVGHAHNCANIGGFPESKPRANYRALAVTLGATGTGGTSVGGFNAFKGRPSPSLVNWFPSLTPGTFTGQSQAAWSVSATGSYVVLGGEFTAVNGVPQQGLVRMAVPSIAPNKQGPREVTWSASDPTSTLNADRSVTVSWKTVWDRDDQNLTYTVLRDGQAVDTRTVTSRFWDRTTQTYLDTSADAGKHSWRIEVSDPDGNTAKTESTTQTVPAEGTEVPEPSPSPSATYEASPSASPSN